MERENLFILQVLMKGSSKTFLNKVWERRLFQMEMCLLVSTKKVSQTVKESMSGKMEHIMKEIFYKDLEMV